MKENKQPILSICIPTWNRRYALKNTLKAIVNQEKFESGDVEIVISDNASTDETEKEVMKLCQIYKNIKYFRNEENVGFGPNIINVLKRGRGEYLWLMGSDDYISNTSIDLIFLCIKDNTPSLILGNFLISPYKNFEVSSEIIFNHYSDVSHFIDNELGKKFLKDESVNCFQIYEGYFSFMSIYCFRREIFFYLLKSCPKNILFHSFNFAYLGLVVRDIDVCFIRSPIICYQGDPHPKIAETKRDMNYKVLRDKIELLRKILKKPISFKSKLYIYRMMIFWNKEYFISVLIKIFKYLGIYNLLSKIWRKFFLKRDY